MGEITIASKKLLKGVLSPGGKLRIIHRIERVFCCATDRTVRVIDDLSVGRKENVPDGCEFVQGNILDESLLKKAVSGIDHICHEAARVTIRGSVDRFVEDAETNLMGSLKLIQAAAGQGVRRFVYASSMASEPSGNNRASGLPLFCPQAFISQDLP